MRVASRCSAALLICIAATSTYGQPPGTSVQISGTVRTVSGQPVAGVLVAFTNGQASRTDGSGNYTAIVPPGFSGSATPSLAGYTFSPPTRPYNNVTVSQSSQDYTASPTGPTTFSISGTVRSSSTGQGIPGVTIFFSNGVSTVYTDSNGFYSVNVNSGYSGTVTASLSGYTFNPSSRPINNVNSNLPGQDFIGTPFLSSTFTISGTVRSSSTSQGIPGAAIFFSNGVSTQYTDSNGYYSVSVNSGYSGTATPSLSGYSFSPPSRPFNNVNSNQPSQDFTGTPVQSSTFTISGTVRSSSSDQGIPGVTISFSNGVSTVYTDSNGYYNVNVNSGYSGTATPSLSGYSFSPPSRPFNNVNSNQPSQDFTGTPVQSSTVTISGTVRASSGQGITGVVISFSNGPTVFTDSNGSYSAAVSAGYTGWATPSLSGYTFTPSTRGYTNILINVTGADYTGSTSTPPGGMVATQSSTLPGYPSVGAMAAWDGNTDGNFAHGSVSATNFDTNAWWQVDLGVSTAIGSIMIWNRTDCCGERLNDYWVFVSDTPFLPTDIPSTLQFRPGTWSSHQTTAPNPSANIPVGAQGRYVRVQLSFTNYLSLAEVQVLGPGTNLPPASGGSVATQSSILPGYPSAGAMAAWDGNTDGNFAHGSVTATNFDTNAWWQVDLGASTAIGSIAIWNRTDCCGDRLNDYWVFVSDTPFLPSDTPATLQFRPGTWSSHQTITPNPSLNIPSGAQGRYVRVQLTFTNYLSLAEVQVLGPGTSPPPVAPGGKVATQSSTLPGYPSAGPMAAVDGNTDGNFADGSVTATNFDSNAWWQVDLGASTAIGSIVIWNRTDCCGSRLNDYWVFVSDTPFLPTDIPSTLQFRPGTWSSHQTTTPNPSMNILAGTQGRYVRVQLTFTNYLSLAEVQVIGPGTSPPPVVPGGRVATQSSTLPGYPSAGAVAAIDGNTDGNFAHGSVTATNLDTNAWWQVDLGASNSIDSITIWNRTDCCGSRLNDYWVFVSGLPFLPTDTPSRLQFRPGTWSTHQTTAPNPSSYIPVGAYGRYVRIQLTGTNYLSLAEVQIMGSGNGGGGVSPLSGSWQGTATDDTEPFGGPPYCSFTVTMQGVNVAASIDNSGAVTMSATATMIEGSPSGCPYSLIPQNTHRFSGTGTVQGTSFTVQLAGASSNSPQDAGTFSGSLNGSGHLTGTLTFVRTDQGPPLNWQTHHVVDLMH